MTATVTTDDDHTRLTPAAELATRGHIVHYQDCTHCKGRGWFLKNPFASRITAMGCEQCKWCVEAYELFRTTGKVPP